MLQNIKINCLTFVLFLFFTLTGCDHPESKQYERNQGEHNKTINHKEEEAKITASNIDNDEVQLNNVLRMEIENGVRYVWIQINGIRLRFIFDTGASSICISPAEATVLFRQGTLRKEDILDIEYFQDATGRISEGTKINLREVKIGDMTLEDVNATVVDNVNAPLLLGQSVLERFGKIEIDNENSEIIFK
jgi:aspartyl protease family protein